MTALCIHKLYPVFIEHYHCRRMDSYCIDFFDTFIRHLKAGTSREQAFILSYKASHVFLKNQLTSIVKGIHTGKDFSALLFNSAATICHKSLKQYLISIHSSIESGQSLLKQMEFLLRKVRQSNHLKNKLKSLVSQSKLQAYVCIALPIFFSLVLYMISPNFILPLFTQSLGKVSLTLCFILLGLGAYWITALVNKDYIQ
ncbi:type II secretion system F family protein [bacterium]|nr:type II secretion system F family protein [bacterium]